MRYLFLLLLLVPAPARDVPYCDAVTIENVRLGYSGVTLLIGTDRVPDGNRARTRCGWYADIEPMRHERGVIARNGPAFRPLPQVGETLFTEEEPCHGTTE